MERRGGKNACHRVVGMSGHPAFGPVGQHDVRSDLADAARQVGDCRIEVSARKLPIAIVQYLGVFHPQHATGGLQFFTPARSQLRVAFADPMIAFRAVNRIIPTTIGAGLQA